MKRIMLFSLVFLGLVFATNAGSPAAVASLAAAVNAPAAQVSVGVVDLEQELTLLGNGGVESTPVTCTLCFTTFDCTGNLGAVCSDNCCTCQVCGGQLGCRPTPGGCYPCGGPGGPKCIADP